MPEIEKGQRGPHPVVIDCDPGIDDVVALALAARSPELQLVAVTTTYGNAALPLTTRNARQVLALAGRPEVSVWPGSDAPLERARGAAPEKHGNSGVGYATVGSADERAEPSPHALLDVLERAPTPLTLVTLGPLTNLAHAIRADASVVRAAIARHIGMAGALDVRGTGDRQADFNAWCDPEALKIVLAAGLATELTPLDVTRQMVVTNAQADALARSRDPLVSWLGDALRFAVEASADQGSEQCSIHDALAIGALLEPGMLDFVPQRIKIAGGEGDARGRTVRADDGVLVSVAATVRVHLMRRLLDRVFGPAWDHVRNEG